MRGSTNLSTAKNILRQMYPMRGIPGTMATSAPKKQRKNDVEETGSFTNGTAEPIVAFNKPPLPPVLGPVVALSLLEMVSNHDTNEK